MEILRYKLWLSSHFPLYIHKTLTDTPPTATQLGSPHCNLAASVLRAMLSRESEALLLLKQRPFEETQSVVSRNLAWLEQRSLIIPRGH